jgi:hypothetical protein
MRETIKRQMEDMKVLTIEVNMLPLLTSKSNKDMVRLSRRLKRR